MQILKLGGSVITKKFDYLEVDEKNLESLAKMLGEIWSPSMNLVIVHGSGSFGHVPVIAHNINVNVKTPKQFLGFADTHSSCSYLSNFVVDRLVKNKIPAISIPPIVVLKQSSRRITKFDDKIIKDLLKKGCVPVLYGDVVLDGKFGGSVCSGDQIVAYLGKNAKRIIFATNVDGVLADGKVVDKITRKNFKDVSKYLKESGAPDVTGGMEGKVKEILRIKKKAYIVNGLRPKRIVDLFEGKETICTEVNVS